MYSRWLSQSQHMAIGASVHHSRMGKRWRQSLERFKRLLSNFHARCGRISEGLRVMRKPLWLQSHSNEGTYGATTLT
jgi:hypothetical protein